jgi:tRNA threonylcarbamoyladenosine biosynthesis protein TsaB
VNLLAIDTSEEACSAALLIDDAVIERFEIAPRRHSELILPMMDGLLAEAGLNLGDLDALAFARGPGSFTGVRIAASVIQGAALGSGLPVVPVSSLQAIAQGACRAQGAACMLIALDARMHEVYWGGYRADAAGIMRAVIDEMVCAPQQVVVPDGDGWTAAGSGWKSYADVLGPRCGIRLPVDGDALVHAQDVARVARTLFAEGVAVTAEQALPVYLRDEVAWAKQS